MIYTDRDIKEHSSNIFLEGYSEKLLGPVSHDLTIKSFVVEDKSVDSFTIDPEGLVIIETNQKISIPKNLMGRIGEKNSRIRQGLYVSGPHYFPGHTTRIFLRVYNMSPYAITLKAGDAIAQIFFEELKDLPEQAYDQIDSSSYNDENEYRGLGKYKSSYEKRMARMQELSDDLDEKENRLYANIITLMGIFVSVFSLIMVNFSQINVLEGNTLIKINLSLGFVITLLMGCIMIFVNRKQRSNRISLIAFAILVVALAAALLLASLF